MNKAASWRVVALMLAALAAACGGGGEEGRPAAAEVPADSGDARQQALLLGGELYSDHRFTVGVCAGGQSLGTGFCASRNCTGALLAPNVVLTARHCVYLQTYLNPQFCSGQFLDETLTGNPIKVTTSPSTRQGTPKWYGIDQVLVPQGRRICGDDLAVLILDKPVPFSEARPVRLDASRDVHLRPPATVSIVGRGFIDYAIDLNTYEFFNLDNGGLVQRVLRNIPFVCSSNDDSRPCVVEDYVSPGNTFVTTRSFFVAQAAAAPGDSGAPVFDDNDFPRRFIGVVAANTFDSNGRANSTLVNRLDEHRTFLRQSIVAGLSKLGQDGGGWQNQVD